VALGLLGAWLALNWAGSSSWAAVGLCTGIAVLCAGIVALWVVWLRGFRVRIKDGVLEYRDGRYQTQRCPLAEIAWCDSQWVSIRSLGRQMSQLRLVVLLRGGRDIRIQMKPFSVGDLAHMRELMGGAEAANGERWTGVLHLAARGDSGRYGA